MAFKVAWSVQFSFYEPADQLFETPDWKGIITAACPSPPIFELEIDYRYSAAFGTHAYWEEIAGSTVITLHGLPGVLRIEVEDFIDALLRLTPYIPDEIDELPRRWTARYVRIQGPAPANPESHGWPDSWALTDPEFPLSEDFIDSDYPFE